MPLTVEDVRDSFSEAPGASRGSNVVTERIFAPRAIIDDRGVIAFRGHVDALSLSPDRMKPEHMADRFRREKRLNHYLNIGLKVGNKIMTNSMDRAGRIPTGPRGMLAQAALKATAEVALDELRINVVRTRNEYAARVCLSFNRPR